ncbi:GGDEF domain-containing protein [Nitrospirillum sp. BR 11828]|uniref:GGDEF domain-containing protein n=1 Tax=Nitrospirillum sp. BR 11828 TaxID=3104325 RepID=UPI002ACADDA8|nr:GGDEF domain-containing protein [Nitrospirillum sp. BR 11828]MDZ5648139.1 GGDEF domain-containing protein [Nitrospirillum sp. BR 11828]
MNILTLLIVNILLHVVAAFCLVPVGRTLKAGPAVWFWVLSNLVHAAGLLIVVSPHAGPGKPPPISSLIGNLQIDWGTMLAFVGVQSFLGLPRRSLWLLAPAGILSCAKIGVFLGVGLHMPINVILGCGCRLLLASGTAWLLIRHAERDVRIAAWTMAGFNLAWAAVLLTRMVWEAFQVLPHGGVVIGDLREPTTSMALLLRVGVTFTLTLGYLWMVGQRLQARLVTLADQDPLTGIANRRVLWEKGARMVERAHQNKQPLGVLMIDIDHFKAINDRWGHSGGDMVIRRVAETIAGVIRATDVVGRVGGEEFAVVLPEADGITVGTVAERIRRAVEQLVIVPGTAIQCTISVGRANIAPDVGWDALVDAADQALYRAKTGGRNRVEAYVWDGMGQQAVAAPEAPGLAAACMI